MNELQELKYSVPAELDHRFEKFKAQLDGLFAVYQRQANSVFAEESIAASIFLHSSVAQITRRRPDTPQICHTFTIHQITARYLAERHIAVEVEPSIAKALDFDESLEFVIGNEGAKGKLEIRHEEVG